MNIIDTIEAGVEVCEKLQEAGHQAVFAGGCVRDFLLGVEPTDIDIATSATPDQVEALFPKTVAVGKSFGVIRVIHDEEEFEVATFRKDSKEGDGRRPDSVEFSSMEEDAKRRDLTINAIFFDPISDKFHDFVNGQRDLHHKIICMVGDPAERIKEDKLRILRVIRFAARYKGAVIESETGQAVLEHAKEVLEVSHERIGDELTKILTHKSAAVGLVHLKNYGLDFLVQPSTLMGRNHIRNAIEVFTFASKHTAGNKSLAWAAALHEYGYDAIVQHLKFLRFDTKTIDRVVGITDLLKGFPGFKTLPVSSRTKMLATEYFDDTFRLFSCLPNTKESLCDFILHFQASTPLSQVKPERLVNGNDLIAMGMKPGKKFKEILEVIDTQQREGIVTSRDEAMEIAKAMVAKISA